MPGPSANETDTDDGGAPKAPTDRLSLVISGLLLAGLLMASAALLWDAPPDAKPSKRPPVAAVKEPPAKQTTQAASVIRLPPPPAPPRKAVPQPDPAPRLAPLKPARREGPKHRPVKPLQRSAAKPAAALPTVKTLKPRPPAKSSVEPIKPAKPATPPAVKAKPVAKKIAAAKPAAKQVAKASPSTGTEMATPAVVDGSENRKSGGALLRLLEHGQGPSIEIAWPRQAAARRDLYRQLTRCYGVTAAVLAPGAADGDKLFRAAEPAAMPWAINMDRFSGFIRSPRGEAIAEEERIFAHIAEHHELEDWRPVRVFPRHVDAALLGGLGAVLGPRYRLAKQIRAAYRWDRAHLTLSGFSVDGRPLAGAVTLPPPRGLARPAGCD